jgi:predicted ATPase
MAMQSWLPYTLVWLAEGLLMTGDIEQALAAADEGLNVVRRTGARCWDTELYRVRGEAMIARKPPTDAPLNRNRDAAEASFWAGITVARQQDARTLELRTTLSLSRLLREAGRPEEAIRALVPVCEQFPSTDETPDLDEARRWISRGAV